MTVPIMRTVYSETFENLNKEEKMNIYDIIPEIKKYCDRSSETMVVCKEIEKTTNDYLNDKSKYGIFYYPMLWVNKNMRIKDQKFREDTVNRMFSITYKKIDCRDCRRTPQHYALDIDLLLGENGCIHTYLNESKAYRKSFYMLYRIEKYRKE